MLMKNPANTLMDQEESSRFAIRFPETLTLKDLITIVSVAISLTVAWGIFSTRIALLEKRMSDVEISKQEAATARADLDHRVRRLESHEQDDALLLDQVFLLLKRPAPVRRADN